MSTRLIPKLTPLMATERLTMFARSGTHPRSSYAPHQFPPAAPFRDCRPRSLRGAPLPPALALGAITVNTTADGAPFVGECAGAPGDCSLRQAIDLANGTGGPDTIVLPAGHYTLTIQGSGDDEDKSGDLDVAEGTELSIEGGGARTTVIDATGLEDRVIDVRPLASLALSKLTVTGGLAISENGGGVFAEEATLTLNQVTVRNNTASESGRGGGVGVDGSKTTISNSLIAANQNSGDGGGLWTSQGEISLVNTTIANNVVDTNLYPSAPG